VKYTGQTFSYLKKNLLLPILAMTVPAVIACFLSTPYWEITFVTAFDYDPYIPMGATFRIIFGDSWTYVWPVVVIAVFQVIGAALVMSAIDVHFRTGKFSLKQPFRQINNTIFPVAASVTVMSVISIVWRFVLFGLTSLIQVIFGAAGAAGGAALAVISVTAVLLFVVHVMILTPVMYWAPIMFIYGYRFRDAAATSFKLVFGKKIFFGLLVPMLALAAMQLIVGFLGVHIAALRVTGFIAALVTNVYTTVYIMVSFYGISGIERRDLKPYAAFPLPDTRKPTEKPASAAPADPATTGSAEREADNNKKGTKPGVKKSRKPESAGAETPEKKPSKPNAEKTQKPVNAGAKKPRKKQQEKSPVKPSAETRTEPKPESEAAAKEEGRDVV